MAAAPAPMDRQALGALAQMPNQNTDPGNALGWILVHRIGLPTDRTFNAVHNGLQGQIRNLTLID